jgi:hypothetical protein
MVDLVDDKLPDWVTPGAKYRWEYGPENPNTGRVFHVRGIVDGHAVVREHLRSKRRWAYTVVTAAEFNAMARNIVPAES